MRARIAIAATLFLGACGTYDPIVDLGGVDLAAYDRDLAVCRNFALQVDPVRTTAVDGMFGAGTGGILGAIVGAFDDNIGEAAGLGASLGAAKGSIDGARRGMRERQTVVNNCLRHRGYAVLN